MPRKKISEIASITHDSSSRTNNPTAEFESLVREQDANPVNVSLPRKFDSKKQPDIYARNEDVDPQLVWKGKEQEDSLPLSVDAAPIFVQEKILPKVLIEELRLESHRKDVDSGTTTPLLIKRWANELPPDARVEFYAHSQKWASRMILGDSLQIMASLAGKEGLRGQVQCVFCDPPYGINFRSNWQPTTGSQRIADKKESETRDPEVVKAYRDTWRDGIHSYLGYARDRFAMARELLSERGSFFLQIGDENVHLLRSVLDEVFGRANFVSQIPFKKNTPLGTKGLPSVCDYLIWYAKDKEAMKMYKLHTPKEFGKETQFRWVRDSRLVDWPINKKSPHNAASIADNALPFAEDKLESTGYTPSCYYDLNIKGKQYRASKKSWRTNQDGMRRLDRADRIIAKGKSPKYRYYYHDFAVRVIDNMWLQAKVVSDPLYAVQSSSSIVENCILMTTDPGDLVLDPTCGSGTTAFASEKWGRRWITTDTSRVALAIARARMMGANYDYYMLQDSKEGHLLESKLSGAPIKPHNYSSEIQLGFVYERCPHIKLSSIANNSEIDQIWERWQEKLEPLREQLNSELEKGFNEWDMPRDADSSWPGTARELHSLWWDARINRQKEIDASILRNSSTEYLRNKPYKQEGILRVAGPFTVESLSPHRVLPTDANDETISEPMTDGSSGAAASSSGGRLRPKSVENGEAKFLDIVFESLRKAGVQNSLKGQRMEFLSLAPWPRSRYIQFEGRYEEKGKQKKVAICVGPEYGTVTRSLMLQAAREAADYFDRLVVLGFAFEAHADEELLNIGKMPVLRARMNNDLHMGERLKAGKSGNLFVVFGEPDIKLRKHKDGNLEVEILGIDIFDPTTGEIKSSSAKDIACWFIDTDYNEEAFFVRHAYFTGGGPDPYKKLKATLKTEVNAEAWEQLRSTKSRPFPPPSSGRIAVKAINDFGDEVLKVFSVPK